MDDKQQRIEAVLQCIRQAAERAGRSADSVTLVAVSKTHPVEDIEAAYAAGVRHFGENRAEEFAGKALQLSHLPSLCWHFIGHLQTRQSSAVAEHAHYFHALDRLKIAERLSRQLEELGRTLSVFIEVNISGEASKGGFVCAQWEQDQTQQAALLDAVRTIMQLPGLRIRGLMVMAPFEAAPEVIRAIFRRLHELSEWLNEKLPDLQARELSMGMSGDFEIAVEEGATYVRVGTAIFGERE